MEEGGNDTAELRRSRKEQERERRRLRDRERRQSMSQDERERHLARRRRNYQLRRQRAEMARLDSQIQAITAGNPESSTAIVTSDSSSGESSESDHHEHAIFEARDQCAGVPVEMLAKVTGTIRLSRLKHLARTLNKSCSTEGSNRGVTEDSNQETRCARTSGLRLSRVKQLMRSRSSG